MRAELLAYFGYVEGWRVLPLDDARQYFWKLDGEGPGTVKYADTEEELAKETGQYYTGEIYTYRHLPKWVYRGADFTMIVVDTNTDGNKFLQVFTNANERP
jgi:hypothetical protein